MDSVDNSPGAVAEPAPIGSDGSALRGPDLARAALEAAREQSRAKGNRTRSGRSKRAKFGAGRNRRGWSGPGADERDPQLLGRLAARIATERGWGDRLTAGRVFSQWETLVGAEIAEHTTPESLSEGVLTVRADSTAWATQLRLLQRQILQRIADAVGPNVAKQIKVQGPAAPSWRRGPRHIQGRGPRDTYG